MNYLSTTNYSLKTLFMKAVLFALFAFYFYSCNSDTAPTIEGETSLILSKEGTIEISASETNYLVINDNGLEIVSNDKAQTLEWDFSTTGIETIKTNAVSGSTAGIQILQKLYSEVVEAPEGDYKTAITDYNGWASYDPTIHKLVLTAGRTFVVKTSFNRYAKFKINSLEGTNPDPTTRRPRDYKITFSISFQKDVGNKKLAN